MPVDDAVLRADIIGEEEEEEEEGKCRHRSYDEEIMSGALILHATQHDTAPMENHKAALTLECHTCT